MSLASSKDEGERFVPVVVVGVVFVIVVESDAVDVIVVQNCL